MPWKQHIFSELKLQVIKGVFYVVRLTLETTGCPKKNLKTPFSPFWWYFLFSSTRIPQLMLPQPIGHILAWTKIHLDESSSYDLGSGRWGQVQRWSLLDISVCKCNSWHLFFSFSPAFSLAFSHAVTFLVGVKGFISPQKNTKLFLDINSNVLTGQSLAKKHGSTLVLKTFSNFSAERVTSSCVWFTSD